MATISVLVGQCGNQLGTEMFRRVAEEAAASADNERYQRDISRSLFRPSQQPNTAPHARAVLIDMEPKVVKQCCALAAGWGNFTFDVRQTCVKNEGSGNNWAFGFHHHAQTVEDDIMNCVRREAEMCDTVDSVQVLHSVAGGTGSGIGSAVSHMVRDWDPTCLLAHTIVWPFAQGEVTSQHYNGLLTLQHLNETADSIAVLANDDTARTVAASAAMDRSGHRPSFEDINAGMSAQLCALLLPRSLTEVPPTEGAKQQPPQFQRRDGTAAATGSTPVGRRLTGAIAAAAVGASPLAAWSPVRLRAAGWADVVDACAIDPQRKFFEVFSVPAAPLRHRKNDAISGASGRHAEYPNATWHSVLPEIARVARRVGTTNALLVLRGARALQDGCVELQRLLALDHSSRNFHLRHPDPSSATLPYGFVDGVQTCGVGFGDAPVYVALAHNSSSFADRINPAVVKAESMLEAGAFVHHFEKYGTGYSEIRDAVIHAHQLMHSYGGPTISGEGDPSS